MQRKKKEESKTAKILYLVLPNDKILITGFENILSGPEIKEKYGQRIFYIYFGYPVAMVRRDFEGDTIVSFPSNPRGLSRILRTGMVLPKDDFEVFVRLAKECGHRLNQIRQSVELNVVRSIKI